MAPGRLHLREEHRVGHAHLPQVPAEEELQGHGGHRQGHQSGVQAHGQAQPRPAADDELQLYTRRSKRVGRR